MVRIQTGGGVHCCKDTQDYIPPSGNTLVTWIDVGDSMPSNMRAGDVLPITGRSANAAMGDTSPTTTSSLSIDRSSTFSISRQNDRAVMNLSGASAGVNGTWGPFGASGGWTIMMFLKVDRPVNDYGDVYIGTGQPMILLSCPSVNLSIPLPSGGAVPASARYTSGNPDGRIDGVVAGAPWDVPFVNHWRQLCIHNNATTNVQNVYVDGWLVSSGSASTSSVPADTPVVIGAQCPMTLAEILVWDGATLTEADIRQTCDAQRVKWGVTLQPNGDAVPVTSSLALTLPVALVQTVAPPTPHVWLDSTRGVYANAAGTTAPHASGRVRVWKDSGTSGNDCTFGLGCNARYGTGPLDRINSKLPVVHIASGPGTFKYNPLSVATSYTAVAVWRILDPTDGGGGHPLAEMMPASVIQATEWKERLGTDVSIQVSPLPSSALQSGAVVVGCWERSASGQSTWRMNTLGDTGGHRWTGMVPVSTLPDVCVGTAGRGLALAQLMVWHRILTATERDVLTNWLGTVWGITLPSPSGGSTVPHAIPSVGVPDTASMALWLDATAGLYTSMQQQTASAANAAVPVWCDRTNHARHATFTNAQRVDILGMPFVNITDTGALPVGERAVLASVGSGPFCVVAVWRLLGVNGGGHPYNPGGNAVFSSTTWSEYIAVSSDPRTMTIPSGLGELICCSWRFDGSNLVFTLGSLTGVHGHQWSTPSTSLPSSWTAQEVVVGTAGRSLQLAELLVWPLALSTAQLSSLEAYLVAKWNLPTYAGPVNAYDMPAAIVTFTFDELNSMNVVWDASERFRIFSASTGNPVTTNGESVSSWWSTASALQIGLEGTTANATVDVDADGYAFVRDPAPGGIAIMVLNPQTGLAGFKVVNRTVFFVLSTQWQSSTYFIHKGVNSTSNPPPGGFNFVTGFAQTQMRINVAGTQHNIVVETSNLVPGQRYTIGMQVHQDGPDVVIWARLGTKTTPVELRSANKTFTDSANNIRFGYYGSAPFQTSVYYVQFTSGVLSLADFNSQYDALKAQYATA